MALALDLLRTLLVACDPERIVREPSLLLFIKDDLCSGLLRFGRLGYECVVSIQMCCAARLIPSHPVALLL